MERSEAWFVAVVAAALGFIAGMAWFDTAHQARWLYEYQTLVTGALAVAAAFVTVNAMNKTEERQQKRHDELLKLNLRADRLRVRRAAYPYSEILTAVPDTMSDAFQKLANCSDRASYRAALHYAIDTATTCKNIMTEGKISEAQNLFGEDMSYNYITAVRLSDRVIFRCQALLQISDATSTIINTFDGAKVTEIQNDLTNIQSDIPIFVDHLRALAKEYA